MKSKPIKAPIELLLIFAERDTSKCLQGYINENGLNAGIVFMGKGTCESTIADIFGFGMSDRDIIACLVPVKEKDRIITQVTELIGIENDKYGLTMLLPLNSASTSILQMFNL